MQADARRSWIRGAAGLIVVLLASAPLLPATPAGASPPGVARPRAATVTLITGERVRVGSVNGVATATVIRAARDGVASQLTNADVRGDRYVIPAAATPYLRRYLDPQLFDVSALAAAGLGDRVPLEITYAAGTTPKLPGVTITSASGGVARGYVTAASAPRFGAALAAQAVEDQRAGWPSKSPLFGSIARVSPGVALPAPASPSPRFPQVTLIIKGVGPNGDPIPFSFGFLENQRDGRKYANFIILFHGEARVSVPLGTYMGIIDDFAFRSDRVTFRVMPKTGIDVTTNDQTVTFDARTARAAPSVTTPLPTTAQELQISIDGHDQGGYSFFSWGYDLSFPGARILLTPTAEPAVGTMRETTQWLRVDPTVAGGRYTYDAVFLDPGVPADQAHTVPSSAHLTTIHETFDADAVPGTAAFARLVFPPHAFFASATYRPLPVPLRRTDYVFAPKGSWYQGLAEETTGFVWDPGFFDGGTWTFAPGRSRSETWLRNPFRMAVPEPTPSDPYPFCYACRTDQRMTFVSFPNDGDPTHLGEVFGSPNGTPVAHFKVYQDGVLIVDKRDYLGKVFPVPTAPATYRIVTDLTRRFTGSFLSSSLRSSVTFTSSASSGPPVPGDWSCASRGPCTVLPVLTANVDVHSPTATVPVGTSTLDVAVGHIRGADDPAITSVVVQVRRTGTAAWTTLATSPNGPGDYAATLQAPPAWDGLAMDMQVTVHDAAGGALVQLTRRAFVVSR